MISLNEDQVGSLTEKVELIFSSSSSEHDLSSVSALNSVAWGTEAHVQITIQLAHLLIKEWLYSDATFYISKDLNLLQSIDQVRCTVVVFCQSF